jgi:lysophospholipase L1-like esterase
MPQNDLEHGSRDTTSLVLASLLIGLVLGLLFSELLLRIVFPIDISAPMMRRIPHPKLGWSLEPSASYINRIGIQHVHVTYNEDGWRDVSHSLPAKRNERRIVVVGDSFMEGYSVALDDSFHRQLEHQLNQSDEGPNDSPLIRVINLGVGGFGTLQEYIAWRDVGRKYQPSIVLLGFYENDLQNNLRDIESSTNKDDVLKVDSRPYLDEGVEWNVIAPDFEGALTRLEKARVAHEASLWTQAQKRSALAQELERIRLWLSGKASHYAAAVERRIRGLTTISSQGNTRKRCDLLYARSWEITKRILRRFDTETRAHGSKLVVFSVPAIAANDFEHVGESPSRTYGNICKDDNVMRSQLEAVTHSLGIDFIDLFPVFAKESTNGKATLFNSADNHWNARGHAIAAEEVASALEGMIQPN